MTTTLTVMVPNYTNRWDSPFPVTTLVSLSGPPEPIDDAYQLQVLGLWQHNGLYLAPC